MGKYESSPHRAVELTEIVPDNKHTACGTLTPSAIVWALRRGPLPLTSSSLENMIARFRDNLKLTFS